MTHEHYMHRCLQLAGLGAGNVAPNPMVGAVLVHEERIIGEGYHMQYGQPHAEVNCMESVAPADRLLIGRSVLYVSLEPCAHFGKTPPCADLVIAKGIPKVVIGCRDPFVEVDGRGIRKLLDAGIEVVTPVLEAEALDLNKRFFTFHRQRRPYVILKWAQTANGIIGTANELRLLISSDVTNRLVHKWRSEEAAILVGTNTALLDNPSLTTRHWPGKNAVRIVVDSGSRLPPNLQLFDGSTPTLVFNLQREERLPNLQYIRLVPGGDMIGQILTKLWQMNLQTVLVEGGAALLQSFIDSGYWDEARVITNTTLEAAAGTSAPNLRSSVRHHACTILSDNVQYYRRA